MNVIKRILSIDRIGRRTKTAPAKSANHDVGQVQLSAIRYLVAQEATAEAELAMRQGDVQAVEQAVKRALSIDESAARPTELRAWGAWRQGRLDRAMAAVEAHPRQTPRLKLLRLLLGCLTGRLEQSHLELAEWSRMDNCPPAARILLALLELDAGRPEAARRAIRRNLDRQLDPESLSLLILVDLMEDLPDATRQAAAKLGLWFGHCHPVPQLLTSLCLRRPARQAAPALEIIAQLAGELILEPRMITTLTVAQRCKPNASRIALLRRAIARIVNDLDDPVPALEAMAELSFLAGDEQMARAWAVRGLKHAPYSAPLALLLDRLGDAEENHEPQVIQTLQSILKQHDYPDVRSALERRRHGKPAPSVNVSPAGAKKDIAA